jgi:hypothetical protein
VPTSDQVHDSTGDDERGEQQETQLKGRSCDA